MITLQKKVYMIRHQHERKKSNLAADADNSQNVHSRYKIRPISEYLTILKALCVNMKIRHCFFCHKGLHTYPRNKKVHD
jgi:hypothetical protein